MRVAETNEHITILGMTRKKRNIGRRQTEGQRCKYKIKSKRCHRDRGGALGRVSDAAEKENEVKADGVY